MLDSKVLNYFENLHKNKAVYLWGANSEVITKELTSRLYQYFKSKTYNKAYYDGKLIDGKGSIGADCSGAFMPVSGFDTTAQGYYNKCNIKGTISKLPLSKVCLVFRKNAVGMVNHIGLYCGNGYTIEMKSSKDNCVKQKLQKSRWTHYGIPVWIEYPKINPYPEPTRTIKKGCQGEDAKWVQWELARHGFETEIDGKIGPGADKAIRSFQKKHRLAVDGRCGPGTRRELKK
jgi:hypothetical protein